MGRRRRRDGAGADLRGEVVAVAFSAEWLALREPVDHAARSVGLTRAVFDALPGERPRILDLGAGTGSNLRFAMSVENGFQARRFLSEWLLVDHDPALLAQVSNTAAVTTRCMDLATLEDRTIFAGRTLVTASALLDLVSQRWLRVLASRCAEVGAAVLFALSYDGRIDCAPADPDDQSMVELVNLHQRTDKGFGPALGPGATASAERSFADLGYRIRRERSDWQIPATSHELQRQLIDGWANAASEIAPERAVLIAGWRTRRLEHVDANRSQILVGHQDLAGVLEPR